MSKASSSRRVEFFGGPKDGMYWGIGKTAVPRVKFCLKDTNEREQIHCYEIQTEIFGNVLRGESECKQRYVYKGVLRDGEKKEETS